MGIEVDANAVDAAIGNMLENLAQLPQGIMREAVDWQEQDMKRQYANLQLPADNEFEIDVWPRSRLSKEHHHPTGRPRGRPRGPAQAAAPVTYKGLPRWRYGRPILRTELWDMLVERMHVLLGTVDWKKSNGA